MCGYSLYIITVYILHLMLLNYANGVLTVCNL